MLYDHRLNKSFFPDSLIFLFKTKASTSFTFSYLRNSPRIEHRLRKDAVWFQPMASSGPIIMKAKIIAQFVLPLILLAGCSSENEKAQDNFPEQLKHRVELLNDGEAIEVRFIEHSQNGERLVQIRTDFRNGVTIFDYFRNDGSLREESEYFPVSDPANAELKDRQVKRVSLYDSDGITLLTKQTYREDGTTESFSRLRLDGGRELEAYSLSGKVIVLHELRNSEGRITLREEFSDSGNLKVQVRASEDGGMRIVQFQDDGITRKSITIRKPRNSPYGYYRYGYGYSYYQRPEYVEYHDDGVTVKMRVEYESSSTTVQYFDENGARLEKRYFSEYGRKTVTAYWPNGEVRYEQTWRGPGYRSDRTDFTDYDLDDVEEFDINGDKVREVEFYDNGVPKVEKVFDGVNSYSGVHRHFNKDGILEREVEVTGYYEYGEEKTFEEAEEEVKADIPSYLTGVEERGPVPEENDLPDYEFEDK